MPYYHCSHLKFDTGHIINPGNWGKIIYTMGQDHNSYNREMFLEGFREKLHPDKPSRLRSTFFCDSLNTIIHYKEKHCPLGYIYKVELVLPDSLVHKSDFNTVELFAGYSMNEVANFYWNYSMKTNVEEWPGVECSELLSESPLRVLRIIDLPV